MLTFNVRGLNNPLKVDRLKTYLQFINPRLDLIFLQEHRLREQNAGKLGKTLVSQAIYLYIEAELGFNHEEDKERVGKRGMALLLANKWAGALRNYGSMFRRHIIYASYPAFQVGR